MERAASVDVGVAACRAVSRLVKARARAYALRPATLELLHPGLSAAPPAALVAAAVHLVERESRSPRRWFGFGGEVGLVNARAALLLGRLERRRLARARRPAGTRWESQGLPRTEGEGNGTT